MVQSRAEPRNYLGGLGHLKQYLQELLEELRVAVAKRIATRNSRSKPGWARGVFRALHHERVHVAAVCYRAIEEDVEFLLVRTRSGRWTFPKGGVDADLTAADAAAREAYEEAGVFGRVERVPFTRYRYSKTGGQRPAPQELEIDAHLCEVVRMVPPEEIDRDPTWFSPEKAKRRLGENR